jgi:hypothetical protein
VIAVLNSRGELVLESIVETKASSILQFVHGLRGEFACHLGRRDLGDNVLQFLKSTNDL